MHKFKRRLMLAAALSAALVAGCGGGGGGGGAAEEAIAAPDIGQSSTALVDFVNSQIAATDETSEPIDIDALTLAVDDSAEPVSL